MSQFNFPLSCNDLRNIKGFYESVQEQKWLALEINFIVERILREAAEGKTAFEWNWKTMKHHRETPRVLIEPRRYYIEKIVDGLKSYFVDIKCMIHPLKECILIDWSH